MVYWPGMDPAASEGQVATAGVWDKFSNWMAKPESQAFLSKLGAALSEPNSPMARVGAATNEMARGQVARQYGEAKKQEQVRLSDALSGNLKDIAADPNVLGVSVKPDGSFSMKFKDPGKDQIEAVIKAQQAQAQGQVQPIAPTPQAQPAPTTPTYGFRGAAEAQAGTNAANASGERFSDAFANPTTSPGGASGLGLSPEELLAVEAGARETVAQPVTNAYNLRLSDQLALATQQRKDQGLIPVDINGRRVLMTPKELIDWENTVMDYNASMEQARNMSSWRADQIRAMEPVRQAQVDVNTERAQKLQEEQERKDAERTWAWENREKEVPGMGGMTYWDAWRQGRLGDIQKQSHALALQEEKNKAERRERATEGVRKMIADKFDQYNPRSLEAGIKAADMWVRGAYPDLADDVMSGFQLKPIVPKGAYKSKEDVKAAYEAGKITKAQALEILRSEFGGK